VSTAVERSRCKWTVPSSRGLLLRKARLSLPWDLATLLLSFSHSPLHTHPFRHFLQFHRLRPTTHPIAVMPEPSQRSSHLSQMTRVDSSDDSFESSYHEDKRTTSVPTKSGTDVALRPHSRSDSLHATSRPSSRASEMTDDINHDDVDLIKKLTATPSAVELDITTRTISKPAADPISEGFNPFKMNAPRSLPQKAQPNQPTQSSQSSQPSQSSQSCQSSQPVPSASFEKSNQEHQSSALSVREERPVTPIPQGLRSIVTWLGSWLTLNLEAPAESREDVQSQLFQTVPSSQIHKAAPRARAPSKGRHRPDRSSVQSQKQCRPRR